MSDDLDVAILAAQTNGSMKQWYGPKHNRVDPRRFIQRNDAPYPAPTPQHHPPQYTQPQHNYGGVSDYGLPEYIPATPINSIPMVVRGRDGKLIDLNEVIQGSDPSSSTSNQNNYQGFQMPSYKDETPESNSSSRKKPEEHPYVVIMKELKSLKKSVNKLIRDLESGKLPTTHINKNEVIAKSANISERIHTSPDGD